MKQKLNRYYWPLVVLILVALGNVASQYLHINLDLTEEKRFSLTPATKQIVRDLREPLFVQILLQGKFPAGFKRLQNGVGEMFEQFKKINPNITYRFEDPLLGDSEEVKAKLDGWAQVGILPTDLNVTNEEGRSSKQIFPFAIFNYGDRQVAINLLERASPGIPAEIALNNSVSLLEYKFANAIAKLQITQKPNILFTEGQGELNSLQTAALEGNLRAFYNTASIDLDSIYQIPSDIAMLIIAKPTAPFSDTSLFKIDQYLMNGGKVIYLIDPLVVNLDSIEKYGQYVPYQSDLGFDDMFFKYGIKVQPNLVLDIQCSTIPLAVPGTGSKNNLQQFPWYYHLLAAGVPDHPITKGLERVNLLFPASIDTVKTKTAVVKTPLLTSSPYTRKQFSPVILDFDILRTIDRDQFVGPPETLAMLLEGTFPSVYENRVSLAMQDGLEQIGANYKSISEPTKILVVADGDVAKNLYNSATGRVRDLGFNPYMKITFANKNFLTNAIEYMLDNRGLIDSRAKTIKLRLLDKQMIKKEKAKWQLINVALPLVFLFGVGWIFQYLRKRKYGVQFHE